MNKKEKRHKRNAQVTSSGSKSSGRRVHSVANQKRLKLIAMSAIDPDASTVDHSSKQKKKSNSKEDDNFGANDEDWNIYLTMVLFFFTLLKKKANEPDPESEEENLEISKIDSILEKYSGISSTASSQTPQVDSNRKLTAEDYQIYLTVERIRVPEIIFQPSIIGIDQMGIPEVLSQIFPLFSPQEQIELAQNVFVTGGNSKFEGFGERIEKELRAIRPVDSIVKVFKASDPVLDSWKGGRLFSSSNLFSSQSISYSEYQEKGPYYFKEHFASNKYFVLS
jgi:actin-related protein 5